MTSPNLIVVAGAMIADGALLVAQRDGPSDLAGLWELPGGKVDAGESDAEALTRELREELGVEVIVEGRLGDDVALSESMTLRAYRVRCTNGTPRADDHRALRWVRVDELSSLPWVPADRAWLPDLVAALSSGCCAASSSVISAPITVGQTCSPRPTFWRTLPGTFPPKRWFGRKGGG